MLVLPESFQVLIQAFASGFTRPSFRRFVWLTFAAILTLGSRTVSNLCRTLEVFQDGHLTSFLRLLSRHRWRPWRLAHVLCSLILALVPIGEAVHLAGDDTIDGHCGKNVYGKGCHRDAVRSSHSHLVYRWGHKWVVLSILVQFPWAKRKWALPFLVALYRPEELNKREGRRHKTSSELMRGLLARLIHWFPDRKFIFSGDQGFGTQELAYFADQHREHLTLVSKLHPDAMLYTPLEPNSESSKVGRPRIRGQRMPSPKMTASHTPMRNRKQLTVRWYRTNNHRRKVKPVPIRWVFVEDLSGTHRSEYFFSTDPQMEATPIIEEYVGRWSLETTFEEMHPYIGLETTRGWSKTTVLRAAPCLFGLYSLVVLLFCLLPKPAHSENAIQWSGKRVITFSDAITQVRRWLWTEGVFGSPGYAGAISKLNSKQRKLLLYGLAPAL